LDLEFHPGEAAFCKVKQCIEQSFDIVDWSLRFSLVRSTAHKAQSTHNSPFLFFGNATTDPEGQTKIDQIDDFVLLVEANRKVVGLDISMQIADLVHGLKSIDDLQTYHQHAFDRKAFVFGFAFEVIKIAA
jgi:hypothetical protein